MFNMKNNLVKSLGKVSAKKELTLGVTALSVLGVAGAKNQNKVSANSNNNINSNHTLKANNIQPSQNKLVKDNTTNKVNQLEQKPEVQGNQVKQQANQLGKRIVSHVVDNDGIQQQASHLHQHILSHAMNEVNTYTLSSRVSTMDAVHAHRIHHRYARRNSRVYRTRVHKNNYKHLRNLHKHVYKNTISRRRYRRHYQLKHRRKHHSIKHIKKVNRYHHKVSHLKYKKNNVRKSSDKNIVGYYKETGVPIPKVMSEGQYKAELSQPWAQGNINEPEGQHYRDRQRYNSDTPMRNDNLLNLNVIGAQMSHKMNGTARRIGNHLVTNNDNTPEEYKPSSYAERIDWYNREQPYNFPTTLSNDDFKRLFYTNSDLDYINHYNNYWDNIILHAHTWTGTKKIDAWSGTKRDDGIYTATASGKVYGPDPVICRSIESSIAFNGSGCGDNPTVNNAGHHEIEYSPRQFKVMHLLANSEKKQYYQVLNKYLHSKHMKYNKAKWAINAPDETSFHFIYPTRIERKLSNLCDEYGFMMNAYEDNHLYL